MYDIENEQVLDFWHGLDDLDNRILRVVDQKSFIEDSLRVLRAMQFAARFGFKVERESCLLCQNISLSDLPKERIFLEFEKMFKGPYLLYGLYYFSALGIAKQLLGANLDRQSFFTLGKELQKGKKYFTEALRPYYFLYIVIPYLKRDSREVLDTLGVPKIYYRKIADVPCLPKKIDCAFVAKMALKNGIVEFVGNYHPRVAEIARKLGVWEKPFDRGITPTELMAEGFSGKALGDELARRTEEKIRGLNEDCS
jgi:tRNA nucleotidyltransferase (CCA-adding enzyme)